MKNLRLDYASTNSLVVKWDTSTSSFSNLKYKLNIEAAAEELDYTHSVELAGDKTQYNFSKLPGELDPKM